MAALVRGLSRAFFVYSPEVEILKVIAVFCGVGLFVSLLVMTYGVDLSSGLF